MESNVLLAIASLSVALAGFASVVVISLLRVIGNLRGKLRNEAHNRKDVIDAIRQATRIAAAYDATLAIRKFMETEQRKIPDLYVATGDTDEPYVPYDFNVVRMWMKPIRNALENELAFVHEEAENPKEKKKKSKVEEVKESSESSDSSPVDPLEN